ncbi:MAG: heavy-metal-associated domain-containing protein [Myxococcales bacterium]|nr:heavy-metal-associated domain-containing protein [Myxococcales bacterium]
MRSLLLVVCLAACNRASEETKPPPKLGHELAHLAQQQPRPRPAKLQQVTIKALGMYCEESCPLKVRTALAEMPAVYELGFDVSNESIFISYDATLGAPKDVTKPMIVAIKGQGFDPWLAKESWPPDAQKVVQVVAR